MWKFISNNPKGMSLVEVMIVMTIMSMIGLGTATLMKNMFSIQNRANVKAAATEIQNNLKNLLENDTSWSNSINLGANTTILGCLQDGSGGCTNGGGPARTNWDVRDNSLANNSYYNASSVSGGFDMNGNFCDAWNAAGNDACPFRYNLQWIADCGTRPAPCNKPAVTIQGTFLFSPTDASDPRNRINVNDYNFTILRGERTRYEPFEIRHALSGGSPPSAPGAGSCTPNTWVPRDLSSPVVYDAGNNVISINTTSGSSNFRIQPGTYECKVVAQAYEALSGFSVKLQDITNNQPYMIGGGFSGFNSTAYATGTVTIELAAPATFEVQHNCGQTNPVAGNQQYDMGIPAQSYGDQSVVTSVSCVRSG